MIEPTPTTARLPDASLYGMPVYIQHHLKGNQKIQIPANFEWCTEAFRNAHNDWLLERFGREEYVCIHAGGALYINQALADNLKTLCIYPA